MAPIAATTVEPGQSIAVAVTVKIGLAAGHVIHVAAIETEGDEDPVVDLITTVTAHARVTFEESGSVAGPLEPGHSRRVEYRVRSFGVEGNPPPPFDELAIRSGLAAEWVGLSSSSRDADAGLVESGRTLAVTLPASNEPGPRSMPLEILDGGGAVIGRRWIVWEVASALQASPAGLVFTTDAQAAGLKVTVRCRDGRPFRIASATTGVDRLLVLCDREDARQVHSLTARLEGPGRPASRSGEIVIRTDHPDQPVVKVAVYVAGRGAATVQDAPEASR